MSAIAGSRGRVRRAGALALSGWVLLIAPLASTAEAVQPPLPSVVVSLTFDDGRASQWEAHQIIDGAGLTATYYVNSGVLDTADYLGWEQVAEIARAGNEIGGHTVSHSRLSDLDPQERLRQVCNDRLALMQRGYEVRSFAYPFSDVSPTGELTAQTCGYSSARVVGGTYDPTLCDGCPLFETTPPADAFRMVTAPQVTTDTDLADLQRSVETALASGGGWVQYVFHDVCDGCSSLALPGPVLQEFVTWLVAQRERGVVVATVGEVVGGPVNPAVPGPAAPPRPIDELIVNPSMEDLDATTEVADDTSPSERPTLCWVHSVNGDVDVTWQRDSDAHSGAAAERLDVTRSAPGARANIYVRHDLGECAIAVRNDDAFTVRAWYRSDVPVRVVTWSRSASGTWRYWNESAPFDASTEWRELVWRTPAVPTDAGAVSVGVAIDSTGYIVVDDVSAALTPAEKTSKSSFTRRDVSVVIVVTLLLGVVGSAISFGHRDRRPKQVASSD